MRLDRSPGALASLLVEAALVLFAVNATGYWDSPLIFSLLTTIVVGGFAHGFTLATELAVTESVAVAIPYAAKDGELRISGQWLIEFLLVAMVAGYSRRISGEAEIAHSSALDRLGRLADANELLFSLHRIAQSLPASLDLDETLDSTMSQLRDLFDFSAAAILLRDEADGAWQVARREGARTPARLASDELPPALRAAVLERSLRNVDNLLDNAGPGVGLVPQLTSGLYVPLLARGSVIGVIAIEHADSSRYGTREADLLAGFAEPAALAIDNARWFSRLRTLGAEEERTRIARDLHDRIGQSLAYLAFELDRIVKADTKGDAVGDSLDRLRTDLRDVIREVRDTLYDLRTDVSDSDDLESVLNLYVQRVAERSGLDITVRSRATARLPLLQEREVFRIAQEALANIEKHAQAQHVSIGWRCDGDQAVLDVVDDGIGFPIGRAGRLDSYGIIGMRERAASIDARLDVESAPGQGTCVRVVVGDGPTPRARSGFAARRS